MAEEVQALRCNRALGLIPLFLAVAILNGCGSQLLNFCRPKPSISSITPATVKAGSADFVLVIAGSDFHSDSTVSFNGKIVTSTLQSANQMSALVTAAEVAASGTISVLVHSPGGGGSLPSPPRCGGGDSNTVMLTVSP